ncbi:hypothetical protein [Kitasatospora sp. NPDC006786]|uniref:hypothetical protein n=1 Tax=unclassified Kitasatospora TaxID=2633591 RepID=UPI0033EE0BD0
MSTRLLLALCIIAALSWIAAWAEQLHCERREARAAAQKPRRNPGAPVPEPDPLP